MREIQVGFGVANEGNLVSEMRGLPNGGIAMQTTANQHRNGISVNVCNL